MRAAMNLFLNKLNQSLSRRINANGLIFWEGLF